MNGLLFIDDEEGVRRSLVRALRRQPYRIYTAENGPAGIRLIQEHLTEIEAVVSDYKMPKLDGMETLEIIGSLNPEITRILLTGYATMEAAIHATNSGIDGFITKPFDNVELRAKIREIILQKRLRQFVPEQIFNEIKHSTKALTPRNHQVSVLFSDIRGFTQMCRMKPPEIIVRFLNDRYFSPLGEIAYQYKGTVDKHIGDGIMVVFGTPVSFEDDALRAVQAAIAMQKKIFQINERVQKDYGLPLNVGIGVASGRVFSGIIGSLRKKEFSSVGMAVNMAARLQAMAAGGEILLSENTFQSVQSQIKAKALPPVKIKGMDESITVYRVAI